MEEDLINAIKANKIFSSLNDEGVQKVLAKFTRMELNQSETLFYQGDSSDNIYLLVSGKLSAALTNAAGETQMVGYIEAGEAVGESGALTTEPRALTVKALEHSVLYRLSSKDFIELCHQYPALMFATIHPVITRSRSLIQLLASEKIKRHIVIVPANKDISLEHFAEKLQGYLEHYPSVVLLSDYSPEFNNQKIAQEVLKEKIIDLEKHNKKSRKFLYLLKSYETPLAKIALRKANIIYITAYSNSVPRVDKILTERFHIHRINFKPEAALILLHTASAVMPHNSASWLAQMPFDTYHHVRMNVTKDYMRLLRFIRGKAVGVILSGGGTRGWAHLGAIKALREQKIPIDMIGGTSVGAIVAGCYAVHESYEDAYERFYKVIAASANSVSWRSITWPAISIFNAKNFTLSLMQVFEDIKIEDLWLPFFCISCNLANNNEEVHRKGLLWQKTRASSSIPGIIPPMVINNELHLDGGLLNNLPVDIARAFLGKKAKIIAVDLNSFVHDRHKYLFPPILTFKQALLAKLGFTLDNYHFPRFLDTFMRGIFMGSLLKSVQNGLAANILVNLDLNKFRLLQSNIKQADKLIQIGYESTLKQLDLIRSEEN
ncbi:MAG TPA: patatin-like phospholipase family protein [Gammaproteobacteria bacterium]|nr:patatin-like phospholipase family protein [Gammaproteobacteria bacterium]